MSVELVKEQVQRFLSSDTPEVLAIKGDWGVGKTYSWDKHVKEFKSECALKSYSYVSLFGINSISELKQTTFLNAIDTNKIGESPNIKGYTKKVADLVKGSKLSHVGGIGGLINSVSELALNKTIICFDDIERHSCKLSIKDFMGLVSFFKEQKECKVVLLLNEDAGGESFNDYTKYKEKIVDRQLSFDPTAEQCFDIMYADNFEFRSYVRDCCIKLNIRNKRVISKIVEHTNEFLKLVVDFDDDIKKQVIHSTIVLSWCYYCHGSDESNVPDFAFINRLGFRKENDETTWEKETISRWNKTLSRYGYTHSDEVDLAVAGGIEQGFIDKEKLLPLCEKKQKEFDVQKASEKWENAWSLFHGSFINNESEIALAFKEGMIDIAPHTSASQYSQGLQVLRTIGKNEEADELIELFISLNRDNPSKFDVDSADSFEVKDTMFVEKLREIYLELKPELTVPQILQMRRGSSSYNQSEADILAKLEVDEIYDLFMSFNGKDLEKNIRVFLLLSGSNESLALKVDEALKRISEISSLNAHRMQKFRY